MTSQLGGAQYVSVQHNNNNNNSNLNGWKSVQICFVNIY